MNEGISYKKAGVDIDTADAAKRAMAGSLEPADPRVLSRLGTFASLFEARFPGYVQPVLVLKMEEPGSKQKLALQHGRVRSLCDDLVNHLVNDIIVMGAEPLAVLDVIICGKLDGPTAAQIVDGLAAACRQQGCTLVGGETSEQPGVLEAGTYVLAASIVGVVEKSQVLDGSRTMRGDVVLAVASNGLHTSGYSLVRALLAERPELAGEDVDSEPFLEAVLRPHTCYYSAFKGLFGLEGLRAIAHITGGGIGGNLNRVLPAGLDARVDLDKVRILPVFRAIRNAGKVADSDMLRTFNMGVGMAMVVAGDAVAHVSAHLTAHGCESYPIGSIVKGDRAVTFRGALRW